MSNTVGAITFRINANLKRRFIIACAKTGDTQTEVLKDAIEKYIVKTDKKEYAK